VGVPLENPLFLPAEAFFGRAAKSKRRFPLATSSKSEPLKVDAILEKISQGGMESLSAEERNFLDRSLRKIQEPDRIEKTGIGAGDLCLQAGWSGHNSSRI